MADINAILNKYTQQANNVYAGQKNATQQSYDQQRQNLLDQYNTALAQNQQQLQAVPGQYQPQRNAAYLAAQKANLAIPAQMSNAGYSSQSGLAYDTAQRNNATWQKSVDTADQAQNTALQSLNNAKANMQNTYQSNLGNLTSQQAKDLAAIDTAQQNWAVQQAQNQYNADLQAENAAAQLAYQKQQDEYNRQQSQNKNMPSLDTIMKNSTGYFTKTIEGIDPNTGYKTGVSIQTISDPEALLQYIYSSGLSPQDQINIIASYPYRLDNGQRLSEYAVNGPQKDMRTGIGYTGMSAE